jgi:soluble lytic murein transglycosylase
MRRLFLGVLLLVGRSNHHFCDGRRGSRECPLVRARFRVSWTLLLFLVFIPCAPSAAQQQPVALKTQSKVTTSEVRAESALDQENRLCAELKPLAYRLLDNRTSDTYSAIEAYIHKNEGTEAAALAWFAIANARFQDKNNPAALLALENAQFKNGLLDDYVGYLRAQIYGELALPERVIETLKDFRKRYPDSLLNPDATLAYAKALMSSERARDAVDVLLENRTPARADIELALGRAYLKAGHSSQGTAILRRIFFKSPLSPEADLAAGDLRVLETSAKLPPVTFAERRARADLLFQGGRWDRATKEFSELLDSSFPSEKPEIELHLAVALLKKGQRGQAKTLLERIRPSGPEQGGERLYRLLEIARADNDEKEFQRLLNKLRGTYPQSQWLDRGLLSAANMCVLKRDYDWAITHFVELSVRFPSSPRAPYALWRASWLNLRQGRASDAKSGFEQHLKLYPASHEVPAVLYWRGRIAEDERKLDAARVWYRRLSAQFVNHYYAQQGRDRLRSIETGGRLRRIATSQYIAPFRDDAGRWQPTSSILENVRVRKSKLLEASGLPSFAVSELRAQAQKERSSWINTEIARLYQESGQYHRALWTLRGAVPSYLSLDFTSLPDIVRVGLFPRPYWQDVRAASGQNGIDPVLTVALIRQESEFNPMAVSSAKAIGLMQLLPSTAATIAPSAGLRGFSADSLLEPATNIRLGARHFGDLLKQFDGTPEYALAAYNAGASRVKDWLDNGTFRDVPEFVEAIPFSETREYVKAIVRNVGIYQSLYAFPRDQGISGEQ